MARRSEGAVRPSERPSAEDEVLLHAWMTGDKIAGEALFERYFLSLARFFRQKLRRSGEAVDDLLQQVFLGLVERPQAFRGEGSFRSYVFGIARKVLFKYYRDQMRQGDRIARSIDPQHSSLAQMGASPSSLMAMVQRDRVIFEALRTLPLDVQIAVELHYWESMTLVEIAAVLECPLGTAKTRLRRGRQLLESALESRLDPTNSF